jgi:hypothetical protein
MFLVLCCFISFLSSAQPKETCNCDSLLEEITEPALVGDIFVKPLPSTVSQYFIDDWLRGRIVLANGRIVEKKRLRYNGFLDRLIWMNEKYQMVKLDKEAVNGFCLYDNEFPLVNFCMEKIKIKEEFVPDSTIVYAQVLYRNNLSLYAYRKVVRYGVEEMKQYKIIADAYDKRTFYYFKTGNHTTKGFMKISRRNLLEILPGRKEGIISYLRSGNYKIKTETDLIGLAEWLNRN